MPRTTIPLSRVVDLNVPLLWQEGVAVARAAGVLAADAGQPLSLRGVSIAANGTVTVAGSRDRDSSDVYGLIAALLQGQPAPSELRSLVSTDIDSDSRGRLEPGDAAGLIRRQVEALEYFATPNPEADIASLAERALEAEAADLARGAVEGLRARAAPSSPERQDQHDAVTRRPTSRVVVGCTIAVAIGLAAFTAMRYADALLPGSALDGSRPADAPTRAGTLVAETVSAAVQSMTSSLEAATDTALARMGLVAASPETSEEPSPGTTVPSRRRTAPGNSLPSTPSISGPLVARGMDVAPDTALVGLGAEVAVPPAVPASGTADVDFARVYSSVNTQVAPPSLVYPQLPTLPVESSAEAAHLSLVVDELGQVVEARLLSTGATINSRMLVFAAKTWRFAPATVDGRPVKYLLQVPVEP